MDGMGHKCRVRASCIVHLCFPLTRQLAAVLAFLLSLAARHESKGWLEL